MEIWEISYLKFNKTTNLNQKIIKMFTQIRNQSILNNKRTSLKTRIQTHRFLFKH